MFSPAISTGAEEAAAVEVEAPLQIQGFKNLICSLITAPPVHILLQVGLPLEDAGDDGLGGDPVAPVFQHHGAQGEQALQVHRVVDLDALQVVLRGDVGGGVPAQVLVVVL
jgi:hypothetical protein